MSPAMREQMIVQYLPLVSYATRTLWRKVSADLSQEDVLAHGTVGLIQAVDRYNASTGVKFQTYALTRIYGAVVDAAREMQLLPRLAAARKRRVQAAVEVLTQRYERAPTTGEIAEYLNVTPAQAETMVRESSLWVHSLNDPSVETMGRDEDVATIADTLIDEDERADALVETIAAQDAVIEAINALSERERLIVSLYFGDDLKYREIAEALGISTARVGQIMTAALGKLRNDPMLLHWAAAS